MNLQIFAASVLPVIFAITVHEASHAYAAQRFGDSTAKALGRLTLNPVKHIDPIGTILLPFLSIILGGFLFGFAKPVPVNMGAFKNPKKDMFWVALAGPGSNFIMAFLWFLVLGISFIMPLSDLSQFLGLMGIAGIQINLFLMAFNLFPLLPLDGGRMVDTFLPIRASIWWSSLECYGFFILIALVFAGFLNWWTDPIMSICRQLFWSIGSWFSVNLPNLPF